MTDRRAAWEHLLRLLTMAWEPGELPPLSPMAWSEIVQLAQANGVAPLLYAAVQRTRAPIPPRLHQALQDRYYQVGVANALHLQELSQVLAALSAAGMPVVLLKGALLAEALYGNPALRPMADLDLLVPRDRIAEVPPLLEPLGYRLQPGPAGHPFAFSIRYGGEIALIKALPLTAVALDIHWNLVAFWWTHYTARLDLEALWREVRPIPSQGPPALQLCPEDTLIHLCLHAGLSHSYASLLNFVDIDRCIAAYTDLDWDRFLQRAGAFQVRTPGYFGLRFTRDLFHTAIPDRVLADLDPGAARQWVVGRLTHPRSVLQGIKPPLSHRSRYLLHLALTDRLSGLLRLVRGLLWPPADWLAARYALSRPAAIRLARLRYPFKVMGMALAALGHLVAARIGIALQTTRDTKDTKVF